MSYRPLLGQVGIFPHKGVSKTPQVLDGLHRPMLAARTIDAVILVVDGQGFLAIEPAGEMNASMISSIINLVCPQCVWSARSVAEI